MSPQGLLQSPDFKQESHDALEDETERTRFANRISDSLIEIHKRGLVEVVSDAVAIYTFGPSAIFSHIDLFLREPLDELPEHDDYYPPTRYRWRHMLKVLRDEGYWDALRALSVRDESSISLTLASTLDYLQEQIQKTSDRDALQNDLFTAAAYAWLDDTLPDAIAYARERSDLFIHPAAAIQGEIPPLIERLQQGVPPSEIGIWPTVKSVDWRCALLAAWLVAMDYALNLTESRESRFKRVSTIHRLGLKGIEYVFLQELYSTSTGKEVEHDATGAQSARKTTQ